MVKKKSVLSSKLAESLIASPVLSPVNIKLNYLKYKLRCHKF